MRFKDDRSASSILGAIMPEQASAPSGRTRVALSREGNRVALEITSHDLTSMRAAVNSYLRWFILARRMAEIAGEG